MIMSAARIHDSRILLQSGLYDWWNNNSVTLAYIIKVLIACLLAMWLSLRFELDQPRTAMMTVAIVMQSRAGMVFAKSFYRLLGTLVGIAMSFFLVAMFAQERVLFLLCMATMDRTLHRRFHDVPQPSIVWIRAGGIHAVHCWTACHAQSSADFQYRRYRAFLKS